MTIASTNPSDDNAALVEDLLSSRRALFVGAHPDDIEFRAGGLVHLMKQRGIEVIFAIATRGGRSLPAALRRPLERMRTRYQLNSDEILGGIEVIFHDYPDGNLNRFLQEFADDLKSLISSRRPDVVLSWDPECIDSAHPDHQAAADAVRLTDSEAKTCFYGTLMPNLWVGFDEDSLAAKIRSIKAHRTESPWFCFDLRQKKRMLESMKTEGAKINSPYAETFRLSPSLFHSKA